MTGAPHSLRALLIRSLATPGHVLDEVRHAYRLAADRRSFLRLAADVCLYRVLRVMPRLRAERKRRIRLKAGVTLTYRLNRGDIQSIREVWMEEAYRLPFDRSPDSIIDLGANIGLTSLWLAVRYRPSRCLAVEPSASNAAIARENLAQLDIPLIEAAVGPSDGVAYFAASAESNLGRVAESGAEVQVLSMETLLGRLGRDTVDLVKVDVEGAEQELFTERTGWLAQVQAMIVEFHPELVDYPGLVRGVEGAGFRYVQAGSAFPDSMDAFVAAR